MAFFRASTVRYLNRPKCVTIGNIRLRSTTNLVKEADGIDSKDVKSFDEIPGPGMLEVMKAVLSGQLQKPWKLIHQFKRDYGPIWKQKLGSNNLVTLTDPKDFEFVLRNEGKYPRRVQIDPWLIHRQERNLGLGVLLHEGADWHRNRAALSKRMMRPREVATYSDTVNDVITDLVNSLVRGRSNYGKDNIVPEIENTVFKWSLDSACSVILNKKLNLLDDKPHPEAQEFIQAVHDMFESLMWLFIFPVHLHKRFNSKPWRKQLRAWDTIFALAKTLIDERVNDVTKRLTSGEDIDVEGTDFITYLFIKGTLEIDEIYANATELLAAAVDTTSNTFLWVLYCLAKHPHVQESLYEEIKRVVPTGESPTHEHVNRMPYLKAVLRETMRVYPPVTQIGRILDRDVIIRGYRIPAKTVIGSNVWLIGQDPANFPDPLEFRPERWIRKENEQFYGFKALPFGYGPRMCIGKRLAELEIHLATIRVCDQFTLEPTCDVEAKVTTITAPDRPLNLRFINRNA
ncbi:1,25-dihydroxyvitamin D(3) 24-hydroxylase, mitochondrial-like [Ptychodera flava]|uniref:1,25-dihydroxyvitamin D(3) 24-hydroxylase, mitochondrial-like n=1 Tax=Ptychodera flava TaxID=63121 RepID=UPI003969FA72